MRVIRWGSLILVTMVALAIILQNSRVGPDDKELFLEAWEHISKGRYDHNLERAYSLCSEIRDWAVRRDCLDSYWAVRSSVERSKELCKNISKVDIREECFFLQSLKELEEQNVTEIDEYEAVCDEMRTERVLEACRTTVEVLREQGYFAE